MFEDIKRFFSKLFSDNSEEDNSKVIKKEAKKVNALEILKGKSSSNFDTEKMIYKLFINDLNSKLINRDTFRMYKEYRGFWYKYFDTIGLNYVSKRIEVYKENSEEYFNDLFNLLVGLGYSEKAELRRNEYDMKKLVNRKFELKDGFKETYNLRIFKPASIPKIMYIYNNQIKQELKESEEYYDIKFSIDIPKNDNVKIKDEILIVVNNQTLRYKVSLESKRNEVDLKKHAIIYNFLNNGENEDLFKEKFNSDLENDLKEINDYKTLTMLGIAKRVSNDYQIDRYKIFKMMARGESIISLSLNKDRTIKRKLSFFEKFKRIFTGKQKQGFLGIKKYLEEGNLNISETNKRQRLNFDYYKFRGDIIRDLNGEGAEKNLEDIFTKNSYDFLSNVRIPTEFYMYLLNNLENLSLSGTDKIFIRNKVRDMLLNNLVFTIKIDKLSRYIDLVFAGEKENIRFVKEKLKVLTPISKGSESELFFVENEFIKGSYIIDLFLEQGIKNYVLLPKGKCNLRSVENQTDIINFDVTGEYSVFKKTKIFDINSSCIYFITHNILKEYCEKNKKIDSYFKEIATHRSLNFESEIILVENNSENKRIDDKFRDFDKAISKEKIEFIKNIENKEDLLNIVQTIDSTENILTLMTLIDMINKLKVKEVSIAMFVEEIIKDKPFINGNIRNVLRYQYDSGVFTENSADAIRFLTYTDKNFEKYLIDMKIQNDEFDGKLTEMINDMTKEYASDWWILDRAYIVYNKVKLQGIQVKFDFYSDISVLNYCLVTGSRQDNALKNDLTIISKNNLLSYYLFKGKITDRECKLALDIITTNSNLNLEYVVEFIDRFYEKELTFNNFNTFEKIKIYLWKSKKGRKIYIDAVNKLFTKESDIWGIEIFTHLDENDIKSIEEILFSGELDGNDKCETLKSFYKICIRQKNKEKILVLNNCIKSNFEQNECTNIIKEISYVDTKYSIEILLAIEKEELYKDIILIRTLLKNLQKNMKVDEESLFSLLNLLNVYSKGEVGLIKEALNCTLKFKELVYTDYSFIIKESLECLDDKDKMKFINSRLYKNECYYHLIYKYKELFKDNTEVVKLLEKRYIEGYIDDCEIKESLMEKYYRDSSSFLNLSHRLYTTEKIIKLMIEKSREKFEKDIYYVEKLINSNSLANNEAFSKLKIHINNKITNYYNSDKYIETFVVKKSRENEIMICKEIEDVFTEEKFQLVSFKEYKLLNSMERYFEEEDTFIRTEKAGSYKIALNKEMLSVSDKSVEDAKIFITKVVKFLNILEELSLNNIFMDKTMKIIRYKEIIFLSECIFDKSKLSDIEYGRIVRGRLKNMFIEENYYESFSRHIFKQLSDNSTLDDIQKVFKQTLKLMDFEKLTLREKVNNFNIFEDSKKKNIILEIIKREKYDEKYIKIIMYNKDLLEKNSNTITYLLRVFYKGVSLERNLLRNIKKFVIKFKAELFIDVLEIDKKNFIKSLKPRIDIDGNSILRIKEYIGLSEVKNNYIEEKEIVSEKQEKIKAVVDTINKVKVEKEPILYENEIEEKIAITHIDTIEEISNVKVNTIEEK